MYCTGIQENQKLSEISDLIHRHNEKFMEYDTEKL